MPILALRTQVHWKWSGTEDTMAEWLRRGIRVPMGLSRISSNLVRVAFFVFAPMVRGSSTPVVGYELDNVSGAGESK